MAQKNSDLLKNSDSGPLAPFEPHFGEVRSFIAKRLRSNVQSTDVEDITQNLYLRLMHRLRQPREKIRSPRAYLFAKARFALRDHWRKARQHNPPGISADAMEQTADMIEESSMNDPEKRLEDQQTLLHLLQMLPTRERDALLLYFRDELKQREVAQKLGITERQVGILLKSALKNLTAAKFKLDSER